jgi:hypothetical protein
MIKIAIKKQGRFFVKKLSIRMLLPMLPTLVMTFSVKSFSKEELPKEPLEIIKKDCQAQKISVSLHPHRHLLKAFSFDVPKIKHDEKYSIQCKDIPILDNQKFSAGKVETHCQDGILSKPDSSSCVDDGARIECSLLSKTSVNKNQIMKLYQEEKLNASALLSDMPHTEEALPNVLEVIPICQAKLNEKETRSLSIVSRGFFKVAPSIPPCSPSSKGLCYLDPKKLVKSSPSLFFLTQEEEEFLRDYSQKPLESRIFLWNKKLDSPAKISTNQIHFAYEEQIGEVWKPLKETTLSVVELGLSQVEPNSCRLTVSGTLSAYTNTNPPKVNTTNDVLVFSTSLFGASGSLDSSQYKISYSGGPSATGVWADAPPGVSSVVKSHVTTPSGKSFSCELVVTPQAQASVLRVRGFSDCNYFNSLRSYYFMDNSNKSYQNKANPIKIPGSNVVYGKHSPEIPFRGILNSVAALNGEIVRNVNGKVVVPPLDRRAFSKAIIVAKKFESKGDTSASNVLFYGFLDPNDYSLTQLYSVPGVEVKSDDSVVFQAYIAGVQPDNLKDLRGSGDSNSLQYYEYAPSTADGQPFDRIIPFVHDSCVPVFQMSVPARGDKPLPSELRNVTQCIFSKPYKVADVLSGRVDLNLVHIVPEHAHHQFPIELTKSSSKPACVSKNPSRLSSCWQVDMKSFGSAANENPFDSHLSCREEKTIMIDATVTSNERKCVNTGCGLSCYNVTTSKATKIPKTIVTYKASCPVLESKNECDQNLALRFSGYNMQMVAALGCAAKYDRPGESIAATLKNQGVLPYTPQLGGSNPMLFDQYLQEAYGTAEKKGYSCIPCRFSKDFGSAMSIMFETRPLPVDQDSQNPRRPLFSFNKSQAPSDCVRDVEFEVRYFGSKECTGTSNPPGHFCSSENLGGQNCPSNPDGGGNIAGKFKIPVCPGSGIEYDSISASWSPIILDIKGNGIEISRDPKLAVQFDIKGDGQKISVDWPVNPKEVAFLVLPNKKGEVTSIKELFGDYKSDNGFKLLAQYDKDKDLKINEKDPIYQDLRLWFDRNRNGLAESDELELLEANGVQDIHLDYAKQVSKGIEGQTLYSVYYNSIYKQHLNVGDFYFHGYGSKAKQHKKKSSKKD